MEQDEEHDFFMHELAQFYKHCLNVGYWRHSEFDNLNDKPPRCAGWMRCRITPYLDDNVTHNNLNFVDDLIFTIDDYYDYFSCFNNGDRYTSVLNRTKKLLQYIKNNSANIIEIITAYKYLFPNKNKVSDNVIKENWNYALIFLKYEDIDNEVKLYIYDDHKISNLTAKKLSLKYNLPKDWIFKIIIEIDNDKLNKKA